MKFEFMPKIESQPQEESLNHRIESLADASSQEASDLIKKNFEQSEDPENNLEFHNTSHTRAVMERSIKALEAMKLGGMDISDIDFALGKIASAFHDTVQGWQEQKIKDPSTGAEKIMRQRFGGKNEKESADLAIASMQRINTGEKQEIFSLQDQEIVRQSIDSTVPGFDPENKTVVQPNLKNESHPVVRALALSDLGTAGIEGGEFFVSEGSSLFREENLDIKRALASKKELSTEEKDNFRQRMLAWSSFQPLFAQGRKNLFEKEIDGLPDGAKESLRNLFSKFDESINSAKEKSDARSKMSFEELIQDFGY